MAVASGRRAWCLIRDFPHYRRAAFLSGLESAGYRVKLGDPGREDGCEGDVLVIWNRYSHWEMLAQRFEQRGGTVLVAENGYLGQGGTTPKFDVAAGDVRPGHYYALACGGHNGEGRWPVDDGARWRALGVEVREWRARGTHVLVCPQRGIGPRNYAQPAEWPEDVVRRLREHTERPVRVRPHPGLGAGAVPLAEDLTDAWAVVIWASGAGIHALVAGVPVISEGPKFILMGATGRAVSEVESPQLPDRTPAFHRLACAQWRCAEIESGEAYRRLLA